MHSRAGSRYGREADKLMSGMGKLGVVGWWWQEEGLRKRERSVVECLVQNRQKWP